MILTWLVLVTIIHGIVGPPVDKKAAAGLSSLLSPIQSTHIECFRLWCRCTELQKCNLTIGQ